MISVECAQQLMEREVPLGPTERVRLSEASGRVLREAVIAENDEPAFDRSAVDGYAVCGEGTRFHLVGVVTTGGTETWSLRPGTAVRIYTGGQVPAGTVVVMHEDVRQQGEDIELTSSSRSNQIRRQGEDAKRGDVLVQVGTRLEAVSLSVLASAGHVQPLVSQRPRVVHVVTGNELVSPEQPPNGSQLRDVNSTLIKTLVEETGGQMVSQARCQDNREALRAIAEAALISSNVLLISGGASVGDFDFGRQVLTELGFTLHFQQVQVRPGKPMVFATRGPQVAMVIPGNPVSHVVCYYLFVRLALHRLLGLSKKPECVYGVLEQELAEKANVRETYWPVRLTQQENGYGVQPLRWLSSGHLSALVEADGWMRIPAQTEPLKAGTKVEIYLWRP
jgi:molybdopterin molybdotransferase